MWNLRTGRVSFSVVIHLYFCFSGGIGTVKVLVSCIVHSLPASNGLVVRAPLMYAVLAETPVSAVT